MLGTTLSPKKADSPLMGVLTCSRRLFTCPRERLRHQSKAGIPCKMGRVRLINNMKLFFYSIISYTSHAIRQQYLFLHGSRSMVGAAFMTPVRKWPNELKRDGLAS